MHISALCGLVLVELLGLSVASLTSKPLKPGQVVSIKAIYNTNFRLHPASELVRVHRRHNVPIPDHIVASASPLPGGEKVPAYSDSDAQYLTPVDFGTPPQRLNLQLDTGSGDLWVYGPNLPPNEIRNQTFYDPSKSSTSSIYPGETWDIQYGSSTKGDRANGSVYWDSVSINALTVANISFGVAEHVNSGLTNNTLLHGIMGLGISNETRCAKPKQLPTWFSYLRSSLKEPLFTVNLNHRADGNFNFGYIDAREHSGPIAYTPVKYPFIEWGWDATGYSIGNGTFQKLRMYSMADTGTQFLWLWPEIAEDYYSQVPGARYDEKAGGFIFPCSTALPDFTFGINNSSYITIPGWFINASPAPTSSGSCFGGIQKIKGGAMNIFGDVALKAALVVFDVGKQRLGWAPKILPSAP